MFRILPEFKYTRPMSRGSGSEPDFGAMLRDLGRLFAFLLLWLMFWPFYSVPTGSRGVVTQFGKIVGIEGEGLTVLPPVAPPNKFHTVEAEQKQKVAVASAEASAVRAKADGDAYAVLANATAEAKAVQLKGEAQAKAMEAQATALIKNPVLVEMRKAEAWDGKLPVNVYAGAPIPFLNVGGK